MDRGYDGQPFWSSPPHRRLSWRRRGEWAGVPVDLEASASDRSPPSTPLSELSRAASPTGAVVTEAVPTAPPMQPALPPGLGAELVTPLGIAVRRAQHRPALVPSQLLGKQTARTAMHAAERVRLCDVGRELAAVPARVWYQLSFMRQLRRLLSRARERRAEARRLIASPPRPIHSLDVGYNASTQIFSFRDAYGRVSERHPTARDGCVVPAYSVDGAIVEPVSPPADSAIVLCPEASGAWCYYDTVTGRGSWHAPEGSTPLISCEVVAVDLPSVLPPVPPRQLCLGSLRDSDWLLLREDARHEVLLISKVTGAVRDAPWISMLTSDAQVYFVNLITRESRWLPPHRWMEGWVSRAPLDSPCGACWAKDADYISIGGGAGRVFRSSQPAIGATYILDGAPYLPANREPLCSAGMLDSRAAPLSSFVSGRRLDDREMLPQQLARLRVDGGAPYMLEYVCSCTGAGHGRLGSPRYDPDVFDSPSSYPAYTKRFNWNSQRGWMKIEL